MRRFTRLTNAFSKRLKNHLAGVAVYLTYYNFAGICQTLPDYTGNGGRSQRPRLELRRDCWIAAQASFRAEGAL